MSQDIHRASVTKTKGIPPSFISEGMWHDSEAATQTYVLPRK